jgi:hypothetical protein
MLFDLCISTKHHSRQTPIIDHSLFHYVLQQCQTCTTERKKNTTLMTPLLLNSKKNSYVVYDMSTQTNIFSYIIVPITYEGRLLKIMSW